MQAIPTGLSAHSLKPGQTEASEKIYSYDFQFVRERILKDGVVPVGQVDGAIAEYRKWLIMMSHDCEGGLSMFSPYVDEVWHTHILFTRDYMELTTAICGAYLHHNPFTANNRPMPKEIKVAAKKFKRVYTSLFGRAVPAIWGLKEGMITATCDGTPSCNTCNNYCTSPGPGCTSDGSQRDH
jgi:hypothetical protein